LQWQKQTKSVALSWFGFNAVPYQVKSTSNLTTWTSSGPVITGGGAFLFQTNSIVGQGCIFYRVGRVVPDNNTAVFNPETGLLTIVDDDQDNLIVMSRKRLARWRCGRKCSVSGLSRCN